MVKTFDLAALGLLLVAGVARGDMDMDMGPAEAPMGDGKIVTFGSQDSPCYVYMEGDKGHKCTLSGPWLGAQLSAPSHFGMCTNLAILNAPHAKGWDCEASPDKPASCGDQQILHRMGNVMAHNMITCMPGTISEAETAQLWFDTYDSFRLCMLGEGGAPHSEGMAPHSEGEGPHSEGEAAEAPMEGEGMGGEGAAEGMGGECVEQTTLMHVEEIKYVFGVSTLPQEAVDAIETAVMACSAMTEDMCGSATVDSATLESLGTAMGALPPGGSLGPDFMNSSATLSTLLAVGCFILASILM